MLWLPTVSVGGFVWAIMSIHAKPDTPWGPIAGIILIALNKVGALIVYVLDEWMRLKRALRVYRRLTSATRASSY
jgi:hypothetical protein